MRDHEFESETATPTAARRRPAPSDHLLLGLQRSAGNRAVSQLLAPARDQAAESEADRIAGQASVALGPAEARRSVASLAAAGTSHLPAGLQTVLRPHLGDTSSVTVDTGPAAGRAADSIGARAFADGSRISLGAGERSAPDAAGLVLHEAAHSAAHAPRRDGPRRLVHAKLKGTRVAVEAQGGGSSSGLGRKLLGRFSKKALTKWDQILHNLTAYEGAETAVLAHGPPPPHAMANATPASSPCSPRSTSRYGRGWRAPGATPPTARTSTRTRRERSPTRGQRSAGARRWRCSRPGW